MTRFLSFMKMLILLLLRLGYSQSEVKVHSMMDGMEFIELGSGEGDFDPAAVVYDIMTKRLEQVEARLTILESMFGQAIKKDDLEKIQTEARLDLLNQINTRLEEMTTAIQNNTDKALQDMMALLQDKVENTQTRKDNTGPSPNQLSTTSTTTAPPILVYEGEGHYVYPEYVRPCSDDCQHVARTGGLSGVYKIQLASEIKEIYCDIDELTGQSYLVIQRRINGETEFYRGWQEYKSGFGDLEGEFYLGNELIHQLTNERRYMLKVELKDQLGDTAFADYSEFSLGSEAERYSLQYTSFSGTAGDSLKSSNGKPFSTYDMDYDGSILYNCARLHKGAFWYSRCGSANLNGIFSSQEDQVFKWQNIIWFTWKNDLRPMMKVEMKIRPIEYDDA